MRPHRSVHHIDPAPPAPGKPRLRVLPGQDEAPRDDLADERRLRASGGPHDTAAYHCACGYVFEAQVSTSVACPHCGTGQAW